jgi:hypothetical protein
MAFWHVIEYNRIEFSCVLEEYPPGIFIPGGLLKNYRAEYMNFVRFPGSRAGRQEDLK